MSTVTRKTTASPQAVWNVLADGWTFGSWVVGASRVRAVEPGFPAEGTSIHHSVGGWPAVLDDSTTVLEQVPDRRLVLLARLRPLGEAKVTVTLEPAGEGTLLRMAEDFTTGPATSLPKPLRQALLMVRNREALHRLALLAERPDSAK